MLLVRGEINTRAAVVGPIPASHRDLDMAPRCLDGQVAAAFGLHIPDVKKPEGQRRSQFGDLHGGRVGDCDHIHQVCRKGRERHSDHDEH